MTVPVDRDDLTQLLDAARALVVSDQDSADLADAVERTQARMRIFGGE